MQIHLLQEIILGQLFALKKIVIFEFKMILIQKYVNIQSPKLKRMQYVCIYHIVYRIRRTIFCAVVFSYLLYWWFTWNYLFVHLSSGREKDPFIA